MLSPLAISNITSSATAASIPVIDLEIGEGYDTPFIVENLRPGDMGSKLVELRNIGTVDGQIAIWVSDIQETDGSTDGAHLDDYMQFEISAAELSTNILMPSTIWDLPEGPFGTEYIWILNVRAGGTVDILWRWEFLENYQPQNEAQGDSLSFTINYLLGDLPPPNPGMTWIEVDVLGRVTTGLLDAEGRSMDQVMAVDANSTVSLQIPKGARCISQDGTIVERISITEESVFLPTVTGQAQIGPIHVVSAFTANSEEISSFMNGKATLRINYDLAMLPSITQTIGLYMYEVGETWDPLPPIIDAPSYIGQCNGQINSTGQVGIIATFDPAESAYFLSSDLNIMPSEQVWWDPIIFATKVGNVVVVSVLVTNIGGVEGTKNITLSVNGHAIAMKQVDLGPLESEQVFFNIEGLEAGDYSIEVSGLGGSVEVGTHINWWLIVLFSCLFIGATFGFTYSYFRWKDMHHRFGKLQGNVQNVESKLLESEMAIAALRGTQNASEAVAATESDDGEPDLGPPEPSSQVKTINPTPVPMGFEELSRSDSAIESVPLPVSDEGVLPWEPLVLAQEGEAPLEAAAPDVMETLQREQDIYVRKVRIAKDFILATILEKGQLTMDVVPQNENAEVAMSAIGQLIDEGRIRALQENHRVIYVMNS